MNVPKNMHAGFRCPLSTKQWAGGLIGGLLFVMSAHISDQIVVIAAAKGTPVTNAYGGLAANIGNQDKRTNKRMRRVLFSGPASISSRPTGLAMPKRPDVIAHRDG